MPFQSYPSARARLSSEVTHRLEASTVFDGLVDDEGKGGRLYRAYAHHLSRACWHGGRIILRQTSPESEGIYDFILELHKVCDGQWDKFVESGVAREHLDTWLEFTGMFLSSLGNHFDDGDQKVVPSVPRDTLKKMAALSSGAASKLEEILDTMLAAQPSSLGYASETSQSCYYPGGERVSHEEAEAVTKLMESLKIAPENTRLFKAARSTASGSEESHIFEILQASAEVDAEPQFLADIEVGGKYRAKVFLRRGDHSVEMTKICANLIEASKYTANETQTLALSQLIQTFRTGDYQAFHAAQQTWVQDKAPRVEHCMGFLFGYRDPYGMRAEWQASAGIADSKETEKMSWLVEKSTEIICTLPWAVRGENNGKGPFEPSELDVPDFAVIHVLASLSSTVWEATNITLDDQDGKRHGVKNIVYGNRMSLNSRPGRPCYYVHISESKEFKNAAHICRFISTATHELIGHGTGKLLAEVAPGKYNFDHTNPPISPVTGEPVKTWYKPGETWISVFGKLAPTVEECRAFLIADYLTDNKSILSLFGYDEHSTPSAEDSEYRQSCANLHC
ncbi:hypothetical protein DL98DRAFT_632565 [Cadophora sp. DSE1049]|nr:hypothetical protein DL98DRAFT_632565 [Cadophora sp. DSE1049]